MKLSMTKPLDLATSRILSYFYDAFGDSTYVDSSIMRSISISFKRQVRKGRAARDRKDLMRGLEDRFYSFRKGCAMIDSSRSLGSLHPQVNGPRLAGTYPCILPSQECRRDLVGTL